MKIRQAVLGMLLLALPFKGAAAPAVAPRDVRTQLFQAMEGNAQLYKACISNIENQFTAGYKARDIFGFLDEKGGRKLRIRFTQGRLRQTDSPYDLAIQGDGFFMLSSGLLTRAGCFRFDSQTGRLLSYDDHGLLGLPANGGELQPILIPRDAVNLEVSADGRLRWTRLNEERPEDGYTILLARVADPAYGLVCQGNHFRVTPRAGSVQRGVPGKSGLGVIAQGHLELSNVNIYEQRLVAEALRRYAGLVGFPVTDDLEDLAPLSRSHPDPLQLQLIRRAEQTGRSVDELTREAVERYLQQGREKPPQNLLR